LLAGKHSGVGCAKSRVNTSPHTTAVGAILRTRSSASSHDGVRKIDLAQLLAATTEQAILHTLHLLSGSSTIIAPYHDSGGGIVGVIDVIGRTRLNYARIVPMVDYTAKVVTQLLAPG
jgi:hypothetical protein